MLLIPSTEKTLSVFRMKPLAILSDLGTTANPLKH